MKRTYLTDFEELVLLTIAVLGNQAYGGHKTVLSELNSIVLTQETANRYFGTTNALGKTLEINGGDKFEPFIVTGTAKNPPQNSSIKFSMLLPFKYNEKQLQAMNGLDFI